MRTIRTMRNNINLTKEDIILKELKEYNKLKNPLIKKGFVFTDKVLTKKLYPEYFI